MEIFYWDNVDVMVIGILTFFSISFGLFYYLIFKSFYKITIKPGWLLYIIPPSMVLLIASINPGYVPLASLGNFPILLILMLLGPVYSAIRNKKSIIPYLLFILFLPITILTWPYGFVLLIAFVILREILTPNQSETFYELQRILPTSKIRTMAMGLVEVSGKTKMLEPVISRIKKEPCIGYLYKIDSVSKDDEGKKSYNNISTETKCNTFEIIDDSGIATVKGEGISILNFSKSDHSYESNGKRYQLFLLEENMKVLVIGKATNKKQQIYIDKEPSRNIFAIAPFDYVQRWNISRPLRNSFIRHILFLIALVSFILLCNIHIEDKEVTIRLAYLFKGFDLKQFFLLNFNK
ncbi:hypothetical protein [Zobellia alginiliquefaciens]|uniref:hypothetical protein n=1 Tax=Zobellia alginiliquefaciens TaxID=3032586 RepID=UPI0023E36455|nr:hypothetical protein [Zobellia alginiliquefaciens]